MTDRRPPRYRLGLTEPLFHIAMPLRDFRGLTADELDRLAGHLREVETELHEYDAKAEPLIAAIRELGDGPWWTEVRAELLRRGEDAEGLDENCGCCYGAIGRVSYFSEEERAPLSSR